MFREMRRKKQLLPEEETIAILEKSTAGVLALSGDEGYPYAVPISYVYAGGKLLFHCAKSGHKLDAVRREPKASFCVIARDDILQENCTTRLHSVIAFGKNRELEGYEKRAAIETLALKYSPLETEESRREEIEKTWKALCLLEMTVEHLTGKEAIELTRERA